MEKIPGLRTVGNASIENKEKEKDELTKRLYNHNESFSDKRREVLNKFEKEKSTEEMEAIHLINMEINELRERMGLETFNIPSDNYNILDQKFYEKNFGTDSSAKMFFHEQGIVFNENYARRSLLSFTSTALHESLHINGHITIEVNEDNNGKVESTHFREGVAVFAAQKKGFNGEFHSHFNGLHEAIVSEQEKRSIKKLIDKPFLKKEKELLFSENSEILKNKIIEDNPEILNEDILWISDDGKGFDSISYEKPRKVLNFVCDKILEKFPEQFSTQDEVFTLFLKAQFTGRLLEIARLVEITFGEGSFRRLGDMEQTSQSAIKTYEALRSKAK